MSMTDRLAEALRAVYPLVPFDGNHDDETRKGKPLRAARSALAEYDAGLGNNAADELARVMLERIESETDPAQREWMRRQLGNVRKLATMI